jgi:hypothetical protein
MMVNTKTLRLSYDLIDTGKASVKTIEVWGTQDGQKWRQLASAPPAPPPAQSITVEVPDPGRWGFKIIARSEVGRGEPNPDRNTQPDNWVEVDLHPPQVKILGTDVAGTAENGQMTIRWTVQDPHLAERPITISYSVDKTTWHAIATGHPNDGRFVWPIPTTADLQQHSVWIKVEAVDLGGNLGSAMTEAAVVIDLAIPKVKIRNLEGIQGVPPPPGMQTAPLMPGSSSMGTVPSSGIIPVTGIEPVSPNRVAPTNVIPSNQPVSVAPPQGSLPVPGQQTGFPGGVASPQNQTQPPVPPTGGGSPSP